VTTIEQTAPVQMAVNQTRRQTAAAARRTNAIPLVAVALAAALGGGVVGGTVAAAATGDAAGKEAVREFARQLQVAREWDERYRQMYPYVR
jgi:hypothetical protein